MLAGSPGMLWGHWHCPHGTQRSRESLQEGLQPLPVYPSWICALPLQKPWNELLSSREGLPSAHPSCSDGIWVSCCPQVKPLPPVPLPALTSIVDALSSLGCLSRAIPHKIKLLPSLSKAMSPPHLPPIPLQPRQQCWQWENTA